MALAGSLQRHDPESVLWVLALDEFTTAYLRDLQDPQIKVVGLPELEEADEGLRAVKAERKPVEYYFTLSPCWPRYLLQSQPTISRITYVDADMFWFSSPAAVLEEMEHASILVTEHRHPPHLAHHQRFGLFNVGLLAFRNDAMGRACLDWWRDRCLEWCYDRMEDGKYADQKYLDEWPTLFGSALHILKHPGVNLAPWNWSQYRYENQGNRLLVDGQPIELYHFARFRPTKGTWWFQSGQLEYGVMPWRVRQYLYGNYWRALCQARERIRKQFPDFDFIPRSARGWHQFWRAIGPRLLFGSDWLRVGSVFISGRLGFGRFSGLLMSWIRTRVKSHVRRPLSADSRPPMPIIASSSYATQAHSSELNGG